MAKLFHMAELSTFKPQLGMGRGTAQNKEKNWLSSSHLCETKVWMKKTSVLDKPPSLGTAVQGLNAYQVPTLVMR